MTVKEAYDILLKFVGGQIIDNDKVKPEHRLVFGAYGIMLWDRDERVARGEEIMSQDVEIRISDNITRMQ